MNEFPISRTLNKNSGFLFVYCKKNKKLYADRQILTKDINETFTYLFSHDPPTLAEKKCSKIGNLEVRIAPFIRILINALYFI